MTVDRTAGRCAYHDDLAWRYDDGSVGCRGALVLETHTGNCRWVEMPRVWLPSKPRRPVAHLARSSTYPWSYCGKVTTEKCTATSIEDTTCRLCQRDYRVAVEG